MEKIRSSTDHLSCWFSTGKMNRQRSAALVDQDMNLRPAFTAVGRIVSCCFSTQRSRYRFAVDSLPFPANPALPIVKANHRLQHLVPDTLLLPRLESFMEDTAGNAEPIAMDCFPLAAHPTKMYQRPLMTARLSARGRPGPRFLSGLGKCFLMRRHKGRGTRK